MIPLEEKVSQLWDLMRIVAPTPSKGKQTPSNTESHFSRGKTIETINT